MTSTSAFISELQTAAQRVAIISKAGKSDILKRAAEAIQHLREEFGFIGAPVRNQAGDIVQVLNRMAGSPDAFATTELKELLTDAAEIITHLSELIEEEPLGSDDD